MTKVISKLYPTYERASQAVRDLETAGVPHKDISIVANNADSWYSDKPAAKRVDRDRDGVDDRAEGAGTGAAGLFALGDLTAGVCATAAVVEIASAARSVSRRMGYPPVVRCTPQLRRSRIVPGTRLQLRAALTAAEENRSRA